MPAAATKISVSFSTSPFAPTRDHASTGFGPGPTDPTRAAISVIMLTKDSSARLAESLAALQWCDEVVIFDTGSNDATLSIAAAYANVSLHQLKGEFPGFGIARQFAVRLARNDWILAVDSDEVVSAALAAEIRQLTLDPGSVYVIPFENYFAGKHITTCGWAPDRHERLFNRMVTDFCTSEVHERLQLRGLKSVPLHNPMLHFSYRDTTDFVRKMGAYSQLFVNQNVGRKRSSATKAVARSVWAFLKSYFLERGCLQGAEGLLISAYKSQTVFWKYMMLREANAGRSA